MTHKSAVVDELNLHRRDYNLVPQIFQNDEPGFTAFSGVFQPSFRGRLFSTSSRSGPPATRRSTGFSQFLANYHCAKVPIFSSSANEMHTLFFGGISQYWLDDNDSLIRDNRLPFVKTVSRVSRLADGSYEEVAFDAELPFFHGYQRRIHSGRRRTRFCPATSWITMRCPMAKYCSDTSQAAS